MNAKHKSTANPNIRKFSTVAEVAERYGVTTSTVLSWINSGELAAVNVSRTRGSKKPRWRISVSALEAFELLRTTTPKPPRICRRRRDPNVIQFY